MCTVVILRRGGHPWPLLLAANRDERLDRPWDPPGPWVPGACPPGPDGPTTDGLVAGRDRLAGGTWMALGRAGVLNAAPNLADLDEGGDLRHQVDFRGIYAPLLRDWLGADDAAILGQDFELVPGLVAA